MGFVDVVRALRGGKTLEELDESLNDLSRRTAETLKSGTLTLTITINPTGIGRVTIADRVSAKNPEPNRESTLFFQRENYDLTRNQPHQVDMGLLHDIDTQETK